MKLVSLSYRVNWEFTTWFKKAIEGSKLARGLEPATPGKLTPGFSSGYGRVTPGGGSGKLTPLTPGCFSGKVTPGLDSMGSGLNASRASTSINLGSTTPTPMRSPCPNVSMDIFQTNNYRLMIERVKEIVKRN
jgi:hypothetical protein